MLDRRDAKHRKQAELQQNAVLNVSCLYLQQMCAWWLKPACCLAMGWQVVLVLHKCVMCMQLPAVLSEMCVLLTQSCFVCVCQNRAVLSNRVVVTWRFSSWWYCCVVTR